MGEERKLLSPAWEAVSESMKTTALVSNHFQLVQTFKKCNEVK